MSTAQPRRLQRREPRAGTTLAAILGAGTPVPAIPRPGVDIFTSGEEGYSCYRIPAIVRLPSGDLAVFVEGRRFTCADHDWNGIVFKTSSDDGATWSKLQLAYSNSSKQEHVTIGNPSPLTVGGEVVLIFCRNNRQVPARRLLLLVACSL